MAICGTMGILGGGSKILEEGTWSGQSDRFSRKLVLVPECSHGSFVKEGYLGDPTYILGLEKRFLGGLH